MTGQLKAVPAFVADLHSTRSGPLAAVCSCTLNSEWKKPWESGHYAKTLFKKPDFRIVLISMERAATIKEHHVDGTISVHALKGSIRFTVQGDTHGLWPGNVLTLGPSIKYELEALEDCAFLLTVSWPEGEKLQAMKHRGYGT